MLEHEDFCVKIGDKAFKEFGIRKLLDEMKGVWKTINFDLKPYPEDEPISSVIRTFESINNILDEHIQTT